MIGVCALSFPDACGLISGISKFQWVLPWLEIHAEHFCALPSNRRQHPSHRCMSEGHVWEKASTACQWGQLAGSPENCLTPTVTVVGKDKRHSGRLPEWSHNTAIYLRTYLSIACRQCFNVKVVLFWVVHSVIIIMFNDLWDYHFVYKILICKVISTYSCWHVGVNTTIFVLRPKSVLYRLIVNEAKEKSF